ncbi:hypothetical protein BN903_108 [Halorubrum sp. AJ67]|nr:hypothetical protein BN903_108 [Halorubrum sp. AJ67]
MRPRAATERIISIDSGSGSRTLLGWLFINQILVLLSAIYKQSTCPW